MNAPTDTSSNARTTGFPPGLDEVIHRLHEARGDWRAAHARNAEQGIHFPSRQAAERISRELGIALFPLRLGPSELSVVNENAYIAASLESTLSQLGAQVQLELRYDGSRTDEAEIAGEAERIVGAFARQLPDIRRALDADVTAAFASDPAARSVDEVLIAYPSITAIIHYRIAHALHVLGAPLVARLIAAIAQGRTGIDIHPGARIGHGIFIDHGVGLVIGETAVIGDRVRLFQGVTLGGNSAAAEESRTAEGQRHPALGDDVIVQANATILGRVTIGARARIGGNVWLTRDVPEDTIVEVAEPALRSIPKAQLLALKQGTA